MSELYQTPSERAKALREGTRTGNFFQDMFTDYVSDGISLNEDGSLRREGAAWWLQGLTPGATQIAEQKKGIEDSRIIDARVQQSGLTPEQIKKAAGGRTLTTSNSGGIIAEAQRTRSEKPTPLQQSEIDRGKAADERQTAALEQQAEASRNQLALAREQMAQTEKLRLLDSADAREARAQELQLMLMRDRKEDRRYNESIDRQDRKDRQASIQTLVAGLAHLGAAFAA